VAVLFCLRVHERLAEKTRLSFSVSLEGKPISDEAVAKIGEHTISSGGKVPIGRHKFIVSHPKAETFETNMFIWYGPHDLPEINLKRSSGLLSLEVRPPAKLLTIRGPEFVLTLTNSGGITSSVPTDAYQVEASFAHWHERIDVNVLGNSTNVSRIAPQLGVLSLNSSHGDTQFELVGNDNRIVERGQYPAMIADLPAGPYKIVVQHHRDRREERVTIKAGEMANVRTEFVFGTAILETEPTGANIASGDGTEWGATPLTLSELRPGNWKFNLHREGFEPVVGSLEIAAGQTNSFRTNLVSRSYTAAIAAARQNIAEGEYDRAAEAASDALRAKPDDSTASALRQQARGLESLQRAESLGKAGNFSAAIGELESAIKALPENNGAKDMLVQFKKREEERADAERRERNGKPRAAFEAAVKLWRIDAELFEDHELQSKMAPSDAESALIRAFQIVPPYFKTVRLKSVFEGTFEIVAEQEVSGGLRRCVIGGAETGNRETTVHFKVLEYKTEHRFGMNGLLSITEDIRQVPLDPQRRSEMNEKFKTQLADGSKIVTERIENALGRQQ
jgi:tetratricopeptide (TPR) repeat protein